MIRLTRRRVLVAVPVLAVAVLAIALVAGAGRNSDDQKPSAAPSSSAPAVTGVNFTDPEGQYTITLDPAWKLTPINAVGKGSGQNEVWLLNGTGSAAAGSGPTAGAPAALGIFARTFTAAETGMSLAGYTKKFIQDNEKVGYTVLKQGTLPGRSSPTLGYVEYQQGTPAPTGAARASAATATSAARAEASQRVIAVFDVRRTMVVVAQVGAAADQFESYRAAALPYLETLKGAGPEAAAIGSATSAAAVS